MCFNSLCPSDRFLTDSFIRVPVRLGLRCVQLQGSRFGTDCSANVSPTGNDPPQLHPLPLAPAPMHVTGPALSVDNSDRQLGIHHSVHPTVHPTARRLGHPQHIFDRQLPTG